MTPYFKVEVKLTRNEPFTDGNGYSRENTTTVSSIEVTGETEALAIAQAYQHVSTLNDWYADGQH